MYHMHYFILFPLLYFCTFYLLPWGEECKLVRFLVETAGLLYASSTEKQFSEEELQLPIKYVTHTTLLICKY